MSTIGELFISLGVKGSEKTVGALTNIKKGLSETASMSLEAKAGIIAAMYALERMFAMSGQAGTGLVNFTALLGVSGKALQQYQYAGRQVGISNQEMAGTFKNLQSSMTKLLWTGEAPAGMEQFSKTLKKAGLGGITEADVKKFQLDPRLLIQKLQQYVGLESNKGLRNWVLKSFGLGDDMISGLDRKAFRSEILAKAPTYGKGEAEQLDKANIAWSNLGNQIEMAMGHFNAKHGLQLVTDIGKITDSVLGLAEALVTVSEKFGVFETVSGSLTGVANSLKLVNEIMDKIRGGKESKPGDLLYTAPGQEAVPGVANSPAGQFFKTLTSGFGTPEAPKKPYTGPLPAGDKPYLPPPPAQTAPQTTKQDINVNQTLNFQHDGKDAKQLGDSVSKANRETFSMFNQGEVA